jgi:predicted nucleic acid-binding protein
MSSSHLTNSALLVADTSPLLALARIDCLYCLTRLFTRVCVTQSVLTECLAKPERADARAVQAALDSGWLVLVPDSPVRPFLSHLDRGEQTALEYALVEIAVVLTDERLGRLAAKAHHIKVIGAPGVLLLAKHKGLLSLIRPKLTELVASGYFLSDVLVAQILELADE